MTRLVSGRILKTPSANVSAERYQFIEISEVEPDLGVPPANNYIFTSDPEGNREWVDARTHLADENVAFGNVYAADTLFGNNLIVRNIDILDALIGETTLANVILAREVYAANVISDRVTSNIWEGIYTANVIESPENLYYSNDRVQSHITTKVSIGDLIDVSNIYTYDSGVGEELIGILEGQALVWDGNIFIPVFVNSEVANVADLAGRVLTIENFTTANVREHSSNLYFTNTRVLDALVEANVIVNDLFVSGDLVVQGNSAVLNVATLVVEDKNIVLANGAISAAIADGAGITIQGADANITYREAGDKIEINKNLEILGTITGNVVGTITGNVIGDITGNVVGDILGNLTGNVLGDVVGNLTGNVVGDILGNLTGNVLGDVVGNLTGDIVGNLTGNVVGNLTGNVLGDVVGNLTGDVVGTVSDISNHTTDDLAEGSNLYYTDARVLANVSQMSANVLADIDMTDISIGQILVWDGNKFIPGTSDIALFSETANSALFANTVGSLEGLTTDDLEEGSANLYFTSRRAIDSFSAGKGIIITEAGTISSVDDSDLYNIAIDKSVYDIVTTDGKSVISINSSPADTSYLVHSLQLTNITDNEVYVSGNIQFASGQNVDLLNRLKMPVGSSLEILEKSLILLPGDVLNLTTFDGNVSVAGTYESVFNDESFINPSLTIAAADADELVYNSNLSYAIIETIKVVNLDNTNIPVKITVTDANNNPKGYLIYNLDIPENSIVDVLQKPKRIENGDKLFASYTGSANSNAVSIFVSGRLGAISGIEIAPAAIDGTPGNTVIAFATTEAEGTTLYYTFTEV